MDHSPLPSPKDTRKLAQALLDFKCGNKVEILAEYGRGRLPPGATLAQFIAFIRPEIHSNMIMHNLVPADENADLLFVDRFFSKHSDAENALISARERVLEQQNPFAVLEADLKTLLASPGEVPALDKDAKVRLRKAYGMLKLIAEDIELWDSRPDGAAAFEKRLDLGTRGLPSGIPMSQAQNRGKALEKSADPETLEAVNKDHADETMSDRSKSRVLADLMGAIRSLGEAQGVKFGRASAR